MKKKKCLLFSALLMLCLTLAGYDQSFSKKNAMNSDLRKLSGSSIALQIGKDVITIDLYDNPTANDLLAQLPLTLTISDYPGYDEKVVRLKKPLSMQGAPKGDDPQIPEFGYYHPGQWLAIYYGHIGYWSGKVPLGRINATVDELRKIPADTSVTIDLIRN